ncbi:MAG: primary-amine oxidase [Candidatus Sulfopaludibacter sp.]|nr:primary-amine oxidase [Candidatus Sulfopaludibacter sp.]
MRLTVCLLPLLAAQLSGANPLAPLTAEEIRAAVAIFKSAGRVPPGARFSQISLEEPAKDLVLRNAAVPRRAFAVVYEPRANKTFEAIANLATQQVDSFKEIPGAQPAVTEQDSNLADAIVRDDPRYQRAMRERGIRDLNAVVIMAWTAGYFALPGTEQGRIVRAVPYYAGYGANFYAHPVEGVVAHVNLTTRKIIDLLDTDRDVPVPRNNDEFTAAATRPWRAAPAPLHITQPNGAGFQVQDGEVTWQKWHFRYALHPREGLVLYTVGYEDGGRVRSIMYRGSLAEMVVPYGDPSAGWFFRNSFDVGELGLGAMASPLRPGLDCPENCTVFNAVVADEAGEPQIIPGAVAIYERDAGVSWKHGDNVRRARELVVGYLTQPGNYEYGFDWIFHQDGTLEMRAALTGIMAVKAVADGAHDPHGHIIEKNIDAVHHQHFFSFRLDLDVDGAANSAVELNSVSMPPGPQNPQNNGFMMQETPLRTERAAERNINLESSRRWIVRNAATGAGYALLPGENAVPLARPESWVRKRAGFLNFHIWVTPFSPTEMYPAGDYPNQSRGGDGLPKWTAADRPIDNKDVVLWYTMGITHNPRPEDWPVMPVHAAGFELVPWGFFPRNPALDLPPGR